MPTDRAARQPSARDGANRDRILAAARRRFGSGGLRATTLRSIAADAGVDVALVAYYFGSKDGLFAATLELPHEGPDAVASALSAPAEQQGEQLARAYLSLWEDPATSGQMLVLTRSALGSEAASDRVRTLISTLLGGPTVAALVAGRTVGFALAMSHLAGVAVTRYVARLPVMVALPFDELVARVAPAVQAHLDTADS
ncbi:TetR family transcriptional regulator [Luteimicrobium subarcticum]|uniref:TetR family transcriptional regulator n=1 Tax=Luteimicrobium subarcticum TaxID=620910 RepID=A0A2M8W6Q1_9MICO|nr:TetR family transcriptional regulator [Luteimicrobium subarcticum]PJI86610.1 TetR family transcriptional regulator [Luteimicrobium subarcticum]